MFSSTEAGSFRLFSVSAMMLALSLMPLLLSRTRRPEAVHSPETLSLRRLYIISPLGMTGALIAGLIAGAFWGLTAPFIIGIGFKQHHAAWFMAASLVGGLFAQWPLGMLSDRINRRWVILLSALMVCSSAGLLVAMAELPQPAASVSVFSLLICGGLFGAGFHPFYSLCIAHANDFIPAGQFVRASAGLQMMQSSGAVGGSIMAGFLMEQMGSAMLYTYIAILAGFFAVFTLVRLMENRIPAHMSPFRLLTRTGLVAFALDPRAKNPPPRRVD